tara:strand:- start:1169 stop:1705 length:537 start_codon:yes stop_codon:yes gene_type:complete
MDSKLKLGLGILGTLGVLGLIRYISRQGKALKHMCISSVSWNWTDSIKSALATGKLPDDAKMELKATNTSNIDLTVNQFLLEVSVDDKHFGYIKTFEAVVIPKNSSRNIYAKLEIDVDLGIDLVLDIIDILTDSDPTEYKVEGYINVSASVLESYSHRFEIVATKDEILSEVSGECNL